MELDEHTNPFSCEDIKNFHKLAQDNGAVFTTKSLVVSRIGKCSLYINSLHINDILLFILEFNSSNFSYTTI